MEAALKAIAAPHRRQILALVRDGELSAGEIAGHFDVTRPAVSQHLTVLKEAGLVDERRNGTRRLYRARPEGLEPIREFLEQFWDERLEALKRGQNSRKGRRMEASTETAVRREIQIAARPETVWEFLVQPEKATRWMGQAVQLDPRPGGEYRVEVLSGNVAHGEFLEVDPPHRLVWTWGWTDESMSPVPVGSTRIEVELEPDGDGTLLRFAHSGLPDAEATARHAHGWDHYLARLEIAARGDDPGRDTWLDEMK